MQGIPSRVSNLFIAATPAVAVPRPPPLPFCFRETRRLQPDQPAQTSFSVAWIVDLVAGAQSRESRQAEINSDSLAGLGASLEALSPDQR